MPMLEKRFRKWSWRLQAPSWSLGENRAIQRKMKTGEMSIPKEMSRDVSPSLGANDELLDYIDTPKLRELYLAWCGENGFEPVAIGAAA